MRVFYDVKKVESAMTMLKEKGILDRLKPVLEEVLPPTGSIRGEDGKIDERKREELAYTAMALANILASNAGYCGGLASIFGINPMNAAQEIKMSLVLGGVEATHQVWEMQRAQKAQKEKA